MKQTKISITKENIYEMVYSAAKTILEGLTSDYDINSPEYREMYDSPDRIEDKEWAKFNNWDELDKVGDEYLNMSKEDQEEEFPRIPKYQSSEEESNGDWDNLKRPGTYMHVRGFLRKNGTSVEEVEKLIDKVRSKYGDPEPSNKEFKDAYKKIWSKSKFKKLRQEYIDEYNIMEFGGMHSFPSDTPYYRFDYFGRLKSYNF